MMPEAQDYLGKAREDLGEARLIAAIGLANPAARSAYYAMFHAAEALIVERTGKIAKTHSGVRTEFARLAKDMPGIDKAFAAIFAKAYSYKEIGDYRVGRDAHVTLAEANEAIANAERFIACIITVLPAAGGGSSQTQ